MQSPCEGRLVRLRAREPEDEPLFFAWMNDSEVTEHIPARYPASHMFERDWLTSSAKPGYSVGGFAVEALADSRLIGSCALRATSPENRSANLGIMLGDRTRWDGGYGTDTMRVLCRFGFDMMNLHRIELDVYAGNARARRVSERIGFKTEGCLRQAHYKYGRYIDVITMGLLKGELE